jgi:hypothetical protein
MRKVQLMAIILLSSGMVAGAANADLVGLRVFREGLYGDPTPVDGPRWIYRVYAEFTNETDSVFAWGVGGTAFGSGMIANVTEAGQSGSGFHNVPHNGEDNIAPDHPLSPRDWDTYMSVGLLYGNLGPGGIDSTGTYPGTPNFIAQGGVWTSSQTAGVLLSTTLTSQGRANHWVYGNDTAKRVFLMQLIVNSGEHVHGTIGLRWIGEGTGLQIVQGLSFTSIPAPSTLLMTVLLTFKLNRRRRSHL